MSERRAWGIRQDFNDLVRDESGRCSPSKIGGMAGQIIAGWYLISHWDKSIASWDILTILLSVLIAPEILKKLLLMKYGGTEPTTTTTATAEVVTTTKAKGKK